MCSSKLNVVNVDIHAVVLSVPRERNSPIHTLQKLFPCCGVNQKVKRENSSCTFLYATKLLGRFLMKFLLNFEVFLRYVGCITLKARNSHTKNGIFNVKNPPKNPVNCKGYSEKFVGLFHLKMAAKGLTFCKVWIRV